MQFAPESTETLIEITHPNKILKTPITMSAEGPMSLRSVEKSAVQVQKLSSPAPAVERNANARCKLRLRHRFLQQVDTFVESSLVHHGVAGITGHIENLNVGGHPFRRFRQLASIAFGHDDIGEDQIKVAVAVGEHSECRLHVGDGGDAVIEATQDLR